MTTELVCWKCGASVASLPLPLSRYAECPDCHADLHVCRMCEFYDPRVADSCREPVAEAVQDKDRANFCDYFRARPDAYVPRTSGAAEQARAELDALFGGGETDRPEKGAIPGDAETAREQLEVLFGKDNDNEDNKG